MTDIVNPGGRPMTGYLQSALDGLEADSRDLAIRVFQNVGAKDLKLAALYRALVVELQLCGLREQETTRQFREMMQASIPEPPLPPATGPAMQFDPETGEFTEIPGDPS